MKALYTPEATNDFIWVLVGSPWFWALAWLLVINLVTFFIFGIDKKRRVCINSPKLDEIRDFIINTLHSGASINELIGAYELQPRREIIAVVDKAEYTQLMKFVNKVDPEAFITIYTVSEIRYRPKPRPHR